MHCPKCAQPAPDEVQFCSRCGFALDGIRSLLAADANPDAVITTATHRSELSPRQKGVRLGAKLVLLFLILLPLFPLLEMIFGELFPSVENTLLDEVPLFAIITLYLMLCVGGLARMLYARLFESAAPAPLAAVESAALPSPRLFETRAAKGALPPAQSIPVSGFSAQRVNTGEMVERPSSSVTDHTTRSLRLE